MDKISCYASLHKQIRDNEDEITMTFKCSASEFDKVIAIPTQTLLMLTVEIVQPVKPSGNSQPAENEE